MLAAITPLLLFAAFILLLLVSLSVPIIKSIDLLKLSANFSEGIGPVSVNANGNVKFGVWGYCISALDASAAGQHFDTAAECSRKHLGYTFDQNVANALHVSGISNVLSRSLTAVLVLHPIACALTFIALFLSLFMLARPGLRERLCSGLTMAASLLAAVVTTLIFLIDVIFVAVVRHKLKNATDGEVAATWGDGTWMTLAATILIWVSVFSACCGIFAVRRRRKGNY